MSHNKKTDVPQTPPMIYGQKHKVAEVLTRIVIYLAFLQFSLFSIFARTASGLPYASRSGKVDQNDILCSDFSFPSIQSKNIPAVCYKEDRVQFHCSMHNSKQEIRLIGHEITSHQFYYAYIYHGRADFEDDNNVQGQLKKKRKDSS